VVPIFFPADSFDGHAALEEVVDFSQDRLGVEHHPVADDVVHAGAEDARGDQVQSVFLIAHGDGVAGVRPAAEADHVVKPPRQGVDDLAFALVAPLQTQDRQVRGIHRYTSAPLRRIASPPPPPRRQAERKATEPE